MSEAYYRKLQLPEIQPFHCVSVRSFTGSNLAPLGLVKCTFLPFEYSFIVCRNLTRPLILGRNFLVQNHIAVRYSDKGKCILDHQQHELKAAVEVEVKPHLIVGNSVSIPGRTLAVVQVYSTLTKEQSGYLYEIEPNHFLMNEQPNLYIIPTIHKVDVYKPDNVPFVAINLLWDSIYLPKEEFIGFMHCQSSDAFEIVTRTSTEPSSVTFNESYDTEDSEIEHEQDVPLGSDEKKFITSPADIDLHRKVDLQDAEVTEEQQDTFKEMCNEYRDIFSVDSGDIGKTPLLEMENDTGDSPPITQKPYTIPLKHAAWVQKELEILEKAGVIVRSVSP